MHEESDSSEGAIEPVNKRANGVTKKQAAKQTQEAALKLVSYTKLDNYKMDNFNQENHALLEKRPLELNDVFDRLLRKNHE